MYLVQRVALVIVLLRQAVARISADEWAARVCMAHRVNVGGGWCVRWSCWKKHIKCFLKRSNLWTVYFLKSIFLSFSILIFSFTGAWYDSKNVFVQAGVQKGAGPRRCHQSVGEEWIFSSILNEKQWKSLKTTEHSPVCCMLLWKASGCVWGAGLVKRCPWSQNSNP